MEIVKEIQKSLIISSKKELMRRFSTEPEIQNKFKI